MSDAELFLLRNGAQLVGHLHLQFHGLAGFHLDINEIVNRTIEHGLSLFGPVPEIQCQLSVDVEFAGTDAHKADRMLSSRGGGQICCGNR